MRIALPFFVLAVSAPLLAQEPCRLAPLDPTSGFHTGGIDLDGRWLGARVGDLGQEWIEVRNKFGPRWLDAEILPSPDPAGSDFGAVLDVDVSPLGVEIFATSPGGSNHLGTGVVRRFIRSGGGWSQVPEIRSADPDAQAFGTNLARQGNVAAIQSKRFLFASTESQVHLFEPLGAISWLETARIDHPDPAGDRTHFGIGMAVGSLGASSLIAISSQEDPISRAWVWRHAAPGQVGLPRELVPSHTRSSEFGAQIAIWNGLVAVSDPGAEGLPGQPSSGIVSVFREIGPGGFYAEVASLVAPVAQASRFGRSLDFEEGQLAVTFQVPASPMGFLARDGLAVIEGLAGGPLRVRSVVAILGDPVTAIGRGVAVGAGEAVTTDVTIHVGNALRLEPALRRFALADPVLNVCAGEINTTGQRATLSVDGCALASGVVLVARRLPPATSGVAVLGTLRGSIPVGFGTLCIGDPRRVAVGGADSQGVMTLPIVPSTFGLGAGDVVLAQVWFRDGFAASNLSGAVTFELAP